MKHLLAIIALTAIIASPSTAQDPATVQSLDEFSSSFTLVDPDCNVDIGLFDPAAQFCWGAYDGGSLQPYGGPGQTVVTDWLTSEFGGASLAGQANGEENVGVMTGFSGGTSGTIGFNTALSGRYVLALKAQTFSLFYFDFAGPITSLDFAMAGTSTNPGGGAQALSNASIWSLETVSVPEPGLMLMLLTGISLLAVGVRRRGSISG